MLTEGGRETKSQTFFKQPLPLSLRVHRSAGRGLANTGGVVSLALSSVYGRAGPASLLLNTLCVVCLPG